MNRINHITTQMVDAVATHRCRRRPHLYIRPAVCRLRKAMLEDSETAKSVSVRTAFHLAGIRGLCLDCPGAVRRVCK